ncbi:MAG: DUF1499 domain-containing protein [Pseudomonadota bacterium]
MFRSTVIYVGAPILVVVLAIAAIQFGWLQPRAGTLVCVGAIALWAIIGLVLLLVGIVRMLRGRARWGRPLGLGMIPIVAAVIGLVGLSGMQIVNSNDVSTDLERPPSFSTGPSAQRGMSESAREAQRRAYPDIGPLTVQASQDTVFTEALGLAKTLGWETIVEDRDNGTIHWVARSRVFRFADDVSLRLSADGSTTVVDIRSRSRVGKSDLGANAKRIRAFLSGLKSRIVT